MVSLYDFVDVIKRCNGSESIKVILLDGDIVDVGVQQNVESEIYFMFAADTNGTQTVTGLKGNLECEASNECWRTDYHGIFDDGRSDLLDCEVRFANCDCDEFFDSDDKDTKECVFDVNGITVEDGIVYLHCEDGFMNGSNEREESTVKLTDEEKEMIKKALNYYGIRLADTQGYSAGEPYWDLMNRF